MNEERFRILAEKYWEGSLSEEEARELLEAPEAWRSRLLAEAALAGLLERTHRPGGTDLAERVGAALRAGSQKEAMVGRVLERLPARGRQRRLLGLGGLAAAALLALGAGLFRMRAPESVPSPVPAAVKVGAPSRPSDPKVEEAVRRAVGYLLEARVPHGPWNGPVPAEDLVLLALRQGGVPETHPRFRELLEVALSRPLERTYTVSLHAVLLRELDPAKYRERLEACAQFLVDNQCENGQWAYGRPTPLAGGAIPKAAASGPGAGNNSCSLFAAMGLRACAEAGVRLPRETIVRARDWWRASRRPDRDTRFGQGRSGWCYSREEKEHHPYGSMTAGGLAALITLNHLAGDDWRKDPAVQEALRWLTYHYTVLENYGPVEDLMAREILSDTPSPMTEYYYYLWALERAATLSGTERFGEHDWYAEGTRELLAAQRADGSWYSGVRRCNPVWDTCYGILFLTRSTRPFGG
ncbi:MAG TPA: prenyltransferase/squalene oxidase repeat-containing protein [Planctomycetota bacterium]|nr:prenyltransferase/squalene oxidase repeat-containing protein [Planctomycetota bacterium]